LTKPLIIYQGADAIIDIESNIDLSAATEIEVTIDTTEQIVKTLTAGGVSDVTSTQFTLNIDSGDTQDIKAGNYKYQVRATIGGKKKQGRLVPNKITLADSVFVQPRNIKDYA